MNFTLAAGEDIEIQFDSGFKTRRSCIGTSTDERIKETRTNVSVDRLEVRALSPWQTEQYELTSTPNYVGGTHSEDGGLLFEVKRCPEYKFI